jgi:hypothetical protein
MSLARLALVATLCAGCVGDYEPLDPGEESPPGSSDDTMSPSGSDAGSSPASQDGAPLVCEQAVAAPGSGNHNAGLACLSCHTGLGDAPRWNLAGTLYAANGVTPIIGATIVIVDAVGTRLELVTKTNGNFFTGQPVVFPAHVHATRCPDTRSMTSGVPHGDCNGCHGAAMRIVLP